MRTALAWAAWAYITPRTALAKVRFLCESSSSKRGFSVEEVTDSVMAYAKGTHGKPTFSGVTTKAKLQNLFRMKYYTNVVLPSGRSRRGPSVRPIVQGGLCEEDWLNVCEMYTRFFSTEKHSEEHLNLRVLEENGGPLLRIFKYLRAVVLDGKARERRDLFANGCGKFLLYEVHPTQDYLVAASTTQNPYKDWCGIHSERPLITGVVDVIIRKGGAVVVGEVKGESGSVHEGLWQLVAAMQVVNQHLASCDSMFVSGKTQHQSV